MALTPEDVVNKRFQQTKFREGYDQDEVDDFLDEIVVELRRLIAENEELKRALDQANAQPQQAPAAAVAAPAPISEPVEAPAPAQPEPAAVEQLAAVQDDPTTPENEAESSNSLLVLARRLHDEHVAEG